MLLLLLIMRNTSDVVSYVIRWQHCAYECMNERISGPMYEWVCVYEWNVWRIQWVHVWVYQWRMLTGCWLMLTDVDCQLDQPSTVKSVSLYLTAPVSQHPVNIQSTRQSTWGFTMQATRPAGGDGKRTGGAAAETRGDPETACGREGIFCTKVARWM